MLSSLNSKYHSKKLTHKFPWFIYNYSHKHHPFMYQTLANKNYLNSQKIPKSNKIIPIPNNQPVVGSNKTRSIPTPNPIKHTPQVFFNRFIFTSFYKLNLVYNMKLSQICDKVF